MHLEFEAEMTLGTPEQRLVAENSPKAGGYMDSQKLCAYNQTRECFLGLEVSAADVPYASLKDLVASLTLQSGEGLWMSPFRGLPDTGVFAPLDLVYLDEDCRVIDVVESFPTFRVTSSSPQAASVLALPTHSIYSSQTQPGDQLMLCAPEEMERRLEGFSSAANSSTVQGAVLLREKPLWSGGPGLLQLKGRDNNHENHVEEYPQSDQMHVMELVKPEKAEVKPPRHWLDRWWSPDPRKAPRVISPGLAAYYWTGAAPEARNIKDISSTGLYVVTEERWYPGTLLLMTLQKTDEGEESSERSIAVHSRAVRWGDDGVGLQFILKNTPPLDRRKGPLVEGLNKKELDRFLKQLRVDKG
jgi:hypothetical protein